MWKKKEEKKEESLLKELCGDGRIPLATQVLTTLFARLKSDRANLADDQSTVVQ